MIAAPHMASASDEDDVKAAVTALVKAFTESDTDAILSLHTDKGTAFNGGPAGDMLAELVNDRATLEATMAPLRAARTPQTPDVQLQHLSVTVNGNMAYTTGYLLIPAAGEIPAQRWRSTMIWVKQGGKWKRQHYHSSPLYP